MALPPGFLDDLRSRISLAQVVGRKVAWDSRKSNPARSDYWAPCPFHQEKTASFHVDDVKGFYYCFGCHAKGDAVSFVRESENLGFMEAVEVLAGEAGLPMPARDPDAAAKAEAAKGLVEAMEAAVQFYRMQLNSARAAEARAYLAGRGLDAETLARFEIGFAPETRSALFEHLRGKGFAAERLIEAGLVGAPEGGGAPYDRFRGRVMFPIRDPRGRAIAFGARALRADQEPKYLNSPDTPLFDKGRTLYNGGPARAAAGKAGRVIVVEGYMDAIGLARAGFDEVVAPLGTAVTEAQLGLIWRMADEPVVALDGDAAGLKAAQRLIDLALPLLAGGKSLRFALLPAGQDPDDVVRAGGAAAMRRLIEESRPIVELLWRRETEGAPLDSPERRAALDARLRGHLERIADAGLRAHYQAEFRARRRALFAPAARSPAGRAAAGAAAKGRDGRAWPPRNAFAGGASPATKASLLARDAGGASEARVVESAILAGCLNHPAAALDFEDRLERMRFACPDLAELRDALLSALAEDGGEPAGSGGLWDAVTRRLGRDPRETLYALGQLRANSRLGPQASPEVAVQAIDEELTRHAAAAGRRAEISEAEVELAGTADEGLTWRLRQAAEAAHSAAVTPLAREDTGEADEAELSRHLQALVDRRIWIKPKPKGR